MKILVVQNRMGIGDSIMFLPFIEAISKKFGVAVTCLVKKSSKADELLKDNKFIKEFIFLEREKNEGYHDGIKGSINLIKKLRTCSFDKIFIFNSSLRFYLIAKFSGVPQIYQYPLFRKKKQHIILTAKNFLKRAIEIDVKNDPVINLEKKLIDSAKAEFGIDDKKKNILFGIGGSGPTKRVPANIIIKTMELINNIYDCKFFLATGKSNGEQKILNEVLNSKLGKNCFALDNYKIYNILPVIKNCNLSICNDSSFSHLSSALGVKTIVLMADTPLIYGNYSSKMYPILPDGENSVSHNTLGKEKINSHKIFLKFKELIN